MLNTFCENENVHIFIMTHRDYAIDGHLKKVHSGADTIHILIFFSCFTY